MAQIMSFSGDGARCGSGLATDLAMEGGRVRDA